MSRIILDIETIGVPFDSLDDAQKEYLLRYADDEEEAQKTRESLALWAPTAAVVAIGMLNPETGHGVVYYQSAKPGETLEENGLRYISGTEKEILAHFWQDVKSYNQMVTFNGRGFDAPMLILRSAFLGVVATKNLMPNRYYANEHLDLLDQFTFFSATRKFNLDFYAKAFGVHSPKGDGMNGSEVGKAFAAGKYLDIARYCAGDLYATKEILEKWEACVGSVR